MLRRFIRWFDHRLSDAHHLYIFNDSPECILRLQDARARHTMQFDNLIVQIGDPILAIHLWSEHLPPISPPARVKTEKKNAKNSVKLTASGDFTWAITTQRRFVGSLRLAAAYSGGSFVPGQYKAVFAATSLFSAEKAPGNIHPMERLGFKVIPYQSTLGSFGIFWENFYAMALIWSYNPASSQGRKFWKLRRSEMWMEFEDFMMRYGKSKNQMEQEKGSGQKITVQGFSPRQ